MPTRVHALLVGINDYGSDIESLDGCLNDVDLLHGYLRRQVDPAALAIETLKNGEATRANIIDRFRSHLGQARSGDVALFQFCGHGARWASSAAFRDAAPDGRDEGLVCSDSRRPGGYDLADKELAVLIDEVAASGAETVVLLDCCHSGSATRSIDGPRRLKARLTAEVTTERPLETYLDGHYARRRDAGASLFVPAGRHILLAACERGQLAQELPEHGLFTSTLVDVLETSGGDVSYAELFVQCRAAVRARVFDQDPQFEAYARFDAGGGFLGRVLTPTSRGRYLAYCDQGAWTVECGAISGMPSEPGAVVTLALYPEHDPATTVGTARALQVGLQKSEIALEFDSAESARYLAEVTSLPAAPTPVAFVGDDATRAAVQEALSRRGVPVALIGGSEGTDYVLSAADGRLALAATARAGAIGFADVDGDGTAAAVALAPIVRHVLRWQRGLALQNHRTGLDRSQVDVVYVERLHGGGERAHEGPETVLEYARTDGEWRAIHGRLRVRNRLPQPLCVALAYFSDDYGIHLLPQDGLVPADSWLTVWGDGPTDHFYLPDGVDRSLERFKLVIATERIDDFLLAQPALTLGERHGDGRGDDRIESPRPMVFTNEWFTIDVPIRVVRRQAP
jgi:hypothetical protein